VAISLFHHGQAGVRPRIYKPHPHAHHIGFAAAIIGLLSVPAGMYIVPSLLAIGLGLTAILLSLHPAPGLNARPEGWAAIALGLMGLAFGVFNTLIQWSL
jgi:hypothetical protein